MKYVNYDKFQLAAFLCILTVFFIIFFTYIKMSKDSSAKYYQNCKERLTKKVPERYQSFSTQEQEKKQQYGWERHKNLPGDEKPKPVKYRKKSYKMRKDGLIIIIRNYFHLENIFKSVNIFLKVMT